MANETLTEQLSKLKAALLKWDQELDKYISWAKSNDGVISATEKKEIDRRKADIKAIEARIAQVEKAKGLASKIISASVGKGGTNKKEDVILVQTLLNKSGYGLSVDGDCGKKSVTAISDFQSKKVGLAKPDGRIDPGGKTWNTLNSSGAITDNTETTETTVTTETTETTETTVTTETTETVSDNNAGVVSGKYFSHKDADKVKISYGNKAIKLNAEAEQLLKSILASAGMTSGYVTSTLRTYADQARINYEQNTADQIKSWYGAEVYAVWAKYKAEKKSTADYAKYLEERDKKRGAVISNHIPGYALDVSPHDKRFSDAAGNLAGKGSGVRKILVEKGCTHTEFTFKVT